MNKWGLRSVGKGTVIREWVRFIRPENIIIGDYCMIDDFTIIAGGRDENSLTILGNHINIPPFVSILGGCGIEMQDFSGPAPGCRFFTDSNEYVGATVMGPTVPAEFRNDRSGRIVLEKYAVQGANTIVLPGITIHEGANTGAGTIVTKDLEAWWVYIGAPARKHKQRDREGVVAAHEEFLRWEKSNEDRPI